MSKLIKLTEEDIIAFKKEFSELLLKTKASDGRISFTKTFGTITRKATLCFTKLAWEKMQALVREFDKEVAWHGVAHRSEDITKDEYIVTDILVYPQTVTGTTVDMDTDAYDKWIRDNCDDERFFNITLQGHSHVRMGTTPSGTDTTHQQEILDQLTDDMFYIFVIWNKQGDKNIKIYDLAKNVMFENGDVDVVVDDVDGIKEFVAEAKELVKEKVYTYPGLYNSNNQHGNKTDTSPNTPTSQKPEDKKQDNQSNNKKSGKRKGKKKKNNKLKVIHTNACEEINKQTYFGMTEEEIELYCKGYY